MTTNSNSESLITNKELRKVFTRSCTLDSAWNYERQQNLMYCYTMLPVLKKAQSIRFPVRYLPKRKNFPFLRLPSTHFNHTPEKGFPVSSKEKRLTWEKRSFSRKMELIPQKLKR